MKCPLEMGVATGPVSVGHVEKPDMVWISMDTPREKLMDELENAKLGRLDKAEVGCVAASVFSEDGALYRVVVLGVSGNEVELRYCDYGNVEKKGMGELLKLPVNLAEQKPLAVQVRVEGVKGVADSAKNRSMLEFSSVDQRRSITSLLCNTKTLLTLAADRHGTYVAQACLPHLTSSPASLLALVNSILGYTATLGQHQCGTFFMQRLVGVLTTHYPGSGAACLLQEDILASLPQLVTTEAGSRLVQAMLQDTQPNTLVRVAKWIDENKKGVIVTKPAVFMAIAVVEQVVQRLGEEGIWTCLLDRLFRAFLDQDKESSFKQSILVAAALHPVGHLLAREIVTKVNCVGEEVKKEVLSVLAGEVDRLSGDKFGSFVLKGLADSVM